MGKLRPFVRKDSYMPNKKWIPFVIGNGYTTTDGASGPPPEYETVTGNPVSFNAITPFPLRQLSVAFSPVQDLHGYDSPWIDSEINREPYTLRGVKGTATRIGNFLYDKLAGGTIAWNQVIPVSAASLSRTANGVVFVDNRDGTYSVTTESGGATANEYIAMQSTNLPQSAKDHVYLFKGTPANGSDSTYRSYAVSSGFTQKFDYGDGYIVKATDIAPVTIVLAYIYSGANISSAITFKPQFIDLTQMFGSSIADYIYSLETANTGDGVAWFKKLFPNPYYAYDTGTLMSVKTSAHVTTEFNQWDEEWEVGYYNTSTGAPVASSTNIRSKNRIYVVGGTSYYVKIPIGAITIIEFDANDNFIKCTQGVANSGITVRPNCCYVLFHVTSAYGTTYNHNICINLSDPARNGEYEPYVKHEYVLDPDLELRGIPKLDANNSLYYDGDIYENDGTVTRKYKSVDLGTLNWTYLTSGSGVAPYFYVNIEDIVKRTSTQIAYQISPVVCAKYVATRRGPSDFVSGCVVVDFNGSTGQIQIKDNGYSNASEFKTAVNGVHLVYELDESTTETADPFTNPQSVSEAGTEEYVDSRAVKIPVGHETYHANICPVEGWTGFNVSQAGKNLLHGTEYSGLFYSSAVGTDLKGTRSGTSYEQSGNETTVTAGAWTGCVFTTEVLPAGTYHIGFSEDSNSRVSAFVTDENLIVESLIRNWAGEGSADTAVTLTESRRISMWIGCGSTGTATVTDLQVELGSSFTEWQAYNPLSRSISISLGQTVYSGTVDAISGVLTVTMASVDLSTHTFTKYGNSPVYYTALSNKKAGNENIISDTFYLNSVAIANMSDGGMRGYSSNGNVYFCKTDCATLADFESFVSANKPTLVYELATPLTIQLTPQEVESLAGDNTMWSNANQPITVTYRSN